jgi:hypothetical protein
MRETVSNDFRSKIEALLGTIDEEPQEDRAPSAHRSLEPREVGARPLTGRSIPDERADSVPVVAERPRWEHSPSLDELFAQFHQQSREAPAPTPPPAARRPDPEPEPLPRSAALEELFAQFDERRPEPKPAAPMSEPPVEAAPSTDAAAETEVSAIDRDEIDAASGAMYRVRPSPLGRGLFACRPIAAQTRLFGEDDWADEAERKIFSVVTPAQLANLTERLRTIFLIYAYNIDTNRISGTFHPEAVRHPTNFMNHSCEPNAGYDGAGSIVALRNIAVDEEIRMDYGTYSFSFDHEFSCTCGSLWCRGRVTRDDWRALVQTGLRLPAFMREQAKHALWG